MTNKSRRTSTTQYAKSAGEAMRKARKKFPNYVPVSAYQVRPTERPYNVRLKPRKRRRRK